MTNTVTIVGGGPAGLMAAETIALGCQAAKVPVNIQLFDAMPSVGRKLLLAGIGGLNITHAESFALFQQRYGAANPWVQQWLKPFGPDKLRQWVHGLGIETFVGSSDRVFPKEMKAAPLLRAWVSRLRQLGVRFHSKHRWVGWTQDNGLSFETPTGLQSVQTDFTVFALGGASWPKLGSDGAWQTIFQQRDVHLSPLTPANCGFEVSSGWSEKLRSAHAGAALKNLSIHSENQLSQGVKEAHLGECVISQYGLEGNLIYSMAPALREAIKQQGYATIELDLLPHWSSDHIVEKISRASGLSISTLLEKRLRLDRAKIALFLEVLHRPQVGQPELIRAGTSNPQSIAAMLKRLPVTLVATRPIEEAISSAGGVQQQSLSDELECKAIPNVFCAGEMLDWEAPTGGYLLTAVFASGQVAGKAVVNRLCTKPAA